MRYHLLCQVVVHHLGPLSIAEKEEFLQPLRDLGPSSDTAGNSSYVETQVCLCASASACVCV